MPEKKVLDQGSESVSLPTLEGIKGALRHLCEVNHKIVEFLQSEYKRKMTLQNYIGEAVLYELLCQSYGIPEYTAEESHKRILSVILGAMRNHQNRPACSLDAIDNLNSLWDRPDDPHSLEMVTPDTSAIRLRKIIEDLTKEGSKEDPKPKGPVSDLTDLWEQPTNMEIFNRAFKNGGRNYTPKKPGLLNFKTYEVQVNGKIVGTFKSDPEGVGEKALAQNALITAQPIIKRRRRKVKKVIRSGLVWNFVL